MLGKRIKILNLTEQLSASLLNYFSKDHFVLIDRSQMDDFETIDFILVENVESALDVSKDYSANKNNMKIIAIGDISNTKSFLLSNGRFVIDPSMGDDALSKILLDKIFLPEHTIHLADSFDGLFEKTREFVLTNHLTMGVHMDRISSEALDYLLEKIVNMSRAITNDSLPPSSN